MPFTKGDKNINRDGRPKLSYISNKELKQLFKRMLVENTNYLLNHQDKLTLRDRVNLQRILASYVLPRLNAVEYSENTNENHAFKTIEIDWKS